MNSFLKEIISWNKFQLVINKDLFSKDIVLKASYNFLDKWYFFFDIDSNWNIVFEFTKRNDCNEESEKIIADYSDELLSVYLRDKLEKDNKVIREAIVTKSIYWPLDVNNFISFDSESLSNNQEKNQIDFDKDIDDILKEIENDPDLKIDEDEINQILKEIESENNSQVVKPKITVSPESIKNAKNNFKK